MAREDLSWFRAFKFIWSLLARHPWLMTAGVILGIGITVTEILSLSLIFPFIESLSGGGGSLAGESKLAFMVPYFEGYDTVEKIRIIAVGIVAIQAVKGILKYILGRLTSYQRILLDRDLRADIFDQIVDLELTYINEDKVANLYTILHSYSSDVASAAKKLLKGVPRMSSFVGYLVAMLLLSWELTIVALVLAAVTTRMINVFTDWIRRMSKKINVLRVRLKHVSLESLNGLKVIHLFGREDHTRQRFREELETYQDNKYQRSSLNAAISPLYGTLMMAMFAGILIAGTFIMDTTAATWVAVLTMFLVVMSRLTKPTARYASTKASLAKKLPSIDEVIRFLDRDDKPYLEDGDIDFKGLQQGLRLEDVRFRYAEDEPDVLKDLSFDIPKGTTVALVGRSGAGKSTTIDLLARLYDPTQGRIVVDGHDLRELNIRSWRHNISVVSQETFLFNQSAMENIRYGRLDATDEEVVEAAKQANAHGFVQGLPEGYQTILGDRGVRLSGGQAQRIAIARAILADPDLLLLDEATSSLDTETEREVQEALDRVSQDRTVVAIAHRLSTIRNADNILVMEDGEIVESGTHEELLSRQGHYWRYVQMQDLLGSPDETSEVEPPATNGHDPSDRPAKPRLLLRRGPHAARLRINGHVHEKIQLIPLPEGASVDDLLAQRHEDVAILQPGKGLAQVRVQGTVHADVPIYLEAKNGTDEPTRITVRKINGSASSSDALTVTPQA